MLILKRTIRIGTKNTATTITRHPVRKSFGPNFLVSFDTLIFPYTLVVVITGPEKIAEMIWIF